MIYTTFSEQEDTPQPEEARDFNSGYALEIGTDEALEQVTSVYDEVLPGRRMSWHMIELRELGVELSDAHLRLVHCGGDDPACVLKDEEAADTTFRRSFTEISIL